MKKRILIGFLCLMTIFGITTQAFAEEGTYEIKEAGITMDIPEEFVVFERIVDEFDPNLELINSSKKQLEQVFKQGNIYLNAVMVPPQCEIVVTLTEDAESQEIFNFNSFKEKELDTLGKNLISGAQGSNGGTEYTDYETYKTDQASFIVLDLIQDSSAGKVYGKQFYTIVNGQVIYITLHSYEGEITSEQGSMIKGVVDSIKFQQIEEKVKEGFMENLMDKISLNTILIGVGIVVLGGIVLIIIAVKRSSGYDEDEEAYDEYGDDEEAYHEYEDEDQQVHDENGNQEQEEESYQA